MKYRVTFVQRTRYAMPGDALVLAVDAAEAEELAWVAWNSGQQVEIGVETQVIVKEVGP
jgi:hypothetical protein